MLRVGGGPPDPPVTRQWALGWNIGFAQGRPREGCEVVVVWEEKRSSAQFDRMWD